jgi:hypothetical protein
MSVALGAPIFTEYRDLVAKLGTSDDHFEDMVEKHAMLDRKHVCCGQARGLWVLKTGGRGAQWLNW